MASIMIKFTLYSWGTIDNAEHSCAVHCSTVETEGCADSNKTISDVLGEFEDGGCLASYDRNGVSLKECQTIFWGQNGTPALLLG